MRKLHLSAANKKIGGVCGGLAESFSLEPSIVRIIFVLLLFLLEGLPLVVYLIMWAILPSR